MRQCWRAGRCTVAALAAASGLALAMQAPVCAQTAPAATPVAKGQMIFESRCGACHSLDAHRVGPALGTVFGRVAGKAADFEYSDALGAASHVWSREKLLAWLTNPEAVVPGQGMGYRLELADDRQSVVAYLSSLPKSRAVR